MTRSVVHVELLNRRGMVAVVKNGVRITISTILSRTFAQLWAMVSNIMKVCTVYDEVPHAVPGKLHLIRNDFFRVNPRANDRGLRRGRFR